MTIRIPDAVLLAHTAVLGKTGSGKTSTAKLAIEQLVRSMAAGSARVCILDPIKSDWWGITSSADGRRPGLPFKILGGPHGHVPLHSSAGKVIGTLVGTGKLPLSIIDMADFEAGGLQRFFVDFAQALWKNARGVVYLVIEEAHEFAPKERVGFGSENLAIHWAKKLATGARTKGIRLIVATHRIQSLHNAVLGSCETLIAHRIMSPADQEPVIKWLRANVEDKALRTEVEASLAKLPTGTGWVCSGEAGIFKRMAFPRIATYDNTKTPGQDDETAPVTMAPVDVGELRELIGEALAVAEANDPIALKARIGELERKLAAAARSPGADAAQVAEAAEAALAEGFERGRRHVTAQIVGITTRIAAVTDGVAASMGHIEAELRGIAAIEGQPAPARPALQGLPAPIGREDLAASLDDALGEITHPIRVRKAPPEALHFSAPNPGSKNGSGLPKGQQAILNSLAWWRVAGNDAPSLAQAGFVAGYRHTSSTFDALRSRAKSAGLIEYPDPGRMRLTEQGARLAVAPAQAPTMMDYHARVRGRLPGPMQKFFDALISRKTLTLEQLGAATGYSYTSSTFDALRSRMKSLELITYPERGKVRIADWLYP
jgi:hypothetical protein